MFIYNELFGSHKVLYKGGGGSSGAVSFPAYMEDRHEDWLGTTAVTTTVSQLINAGLATNPLESLEYTDPASKETSIETALTAHKTAVGAADADVDYSAAVAEAAAEVDTLGVLNEIDVTVIAGEARTGGTAAVQAAVLAALAAIDDGRVYEAVQEFVNARRKQRAELRTRYKANMASVGAERGSAYAIGLALLEMDFERETGAYQVELSTQMYQQGLQLFAATFVEELQSRIRTAGLEKQSRDSILSQGIQLHLGYQQFLYELSRGAIALEGEVNRLNFVMDSEYVGNTGDLNWKYAMWDWNVYQSASNVLGGIGGGTYVPEGPSKAGSAIGGALSGAVVGAQVGGPVGAGIGAVVGGLAGIFG